MAKAQRTPEGYKRFLAYAKERKRKLRKDPEFRAKESELSKLRYQNNKEKYKEITRKWQRENREVLLERRRQWRRDNPELAKQADRRNRESSVRFAISRVRDGTMGLSELNSRIHTALVRLDDRARRIGRESGNDGLRSGETDPEPDETSARRSKGSQGTK